MPAHSKTLRKAKSCSKCGLDASLDYVSTNEEIYHKFCFKCEVCDLKLNSNNHFKKPAGNLVCLSHTMHPCPVEFAYVEEGNIPQELLCDICTRPFEDPIEHLPIGNGGCSHIYCKKCAGNRTTCPHCRNDVKWQLVSTTAPTIQRFLFNPLAELKVTCSLCKGQTTRGELKNHLRLCLVDCPLGCGEKAAPKDFETHIGVCLAVKVRCPAADVMCSWTGPRRNEAAHYKSCPYHQIRPVLSTLMQVLR